MSKTLVQPVGQKRLTNVAVVRLKKHGVRFEIACYKNKVLSWRSGVEKDLDEVLQSQTVYSNVSKGVLAKSKDLVAAFGTDDQTNICLEILDKGELQVAGKERDSQLSSQFRDIATIVMQKTINPETQRPYTISMIERLMHEIHFAVDPHSSSKKQSLDVIRELQKHLPIKLSPMRLRLYVLEQKFSSLSEKLNDWTASIVSKDESGSQLSIQFSTEVLRMQQEIARLRENTAHFQATVETKLETLRCELLKCCISCLPSYHLQFMEFSYHCSCPCHDCCGSFGCDGNSGYPTECCFCGEPHNVNRDCC